MKKEHIVRKNEEFYEIIKKGCYESNKLFTIYLLLRDSSKYRFGISVGKKIGNAVLRNKIKRQLRHIIMMNSELYLPKENYIIIVRKEYLNVPFNIIKEEYVKSLNKLKRRIYEEKK